LPAAHGAGDPIFDAAERAGAAACGTETSVYFASGYFIGMVALASPEDSATSLREDGKPPAPHALGDTWLFGHQVGNMKAAIAAYLGAVDALMRSGVPLKGALTIAGVVGTEPSSSWMDGNPLSMEQELGAGVHAQARCDRRNVRHRRADSSDPHPRSIRPGSSQGRPERGLSGADLKMKAPLAAFEEWMLASQTARSVNEAFSSAVISGNPLPQRLQAHGRMRPLF
jgi:hypothetical protein